MSEERSDCSIAEGLLSELWERRLEGPERAADQLWLRRHLEGCAACAAVAGVWAALGALPETAPDPEQRRRFDQMLAGYQQGLHDQRTAARRWTWFPGRAWQPLAALAATAILVAGLAGGWLLRGAVSRGGNPPQTQEIADLQQQVQATRQLVVLSLLQQQSASDRLQGVSYTNRLQGLDPQVVEALLHSLKYDASPDVRLAALDALQRDAAQPGIQKGLVESFRYQKSPLVQIALMDSFLEARNPQGRSLLRQVSTDAAYSPEVRQRAAWGLAQPAWN